VVNIRGVGLHVFDVQTSTFSPIPNPGGSVRTGVADISPDGKTVYLTSRPPGGAATGGPFTELVAVDVASGAERKLADLAALGHAGGSPAIAVSPDGQSVALQVRLQPAGPVVRARLALIAADGSASRFLSEAYQTVYIPSTIAWTPDGQSVLFFTGSAQQSTWRLMRVSAGGGEPVFDGLERATLQNDSSLPVLAPPPPLSLTISPDGTHVAFGAYAGQSSQLVALDNVYSAIARAR
jgi:Tol biopolymer transport system component